ncbi:MAG TPA: 50S ribosomal protein L11 methyltransferase [Nitrospiria bacterium]|nr:50S ribosomal protein L11 methyltransferase [Nitrospiria bacterium]
MPGTRFPNEVFFDRISRKMINAAPRWTEISLALPAVFQEALVDFLIGLGSQGVLLEEAPRGRSLLKVYFRDDEGTPGKIDTLVARLRRIGLSRRFRLTTRHISEEDWTRSWQRHSVKLQPIGMKLLVRAPWHNVPMKWGDRIAVTVDPAMAFGTGTHATTRHCLEFIDKICSRRSKPKNLIDVGCGSGILAIAAAKLSVAEVTAVDDDPVALDAARTNARINRTRNIRFRNRIPEKKTFDLVVANITSGTLISLKNRITGALRPEGRLILSGMLADQTAEVLDAYKGFEVVAEKKSGKWRSMLLNKKDRNGFTARMRTAN